MNAHRVLILLIKWPEKWNIVHCESADCSYGRLKELIKPHLSSSLPRLLFGVLSSRPFSKEWLNIISDYKKLQGSILF